VEAEGGDPVDASDREDGDRPEARVLAGRRALVVGGGGGLGRAMAHALADAGARVAIMGRSDSADEAAGELATPGFAVRADVADRADLRRGFDEVVERHGGLDVLITAQGATIPSPALDHGLDAWDVTIETNLTAVFELTQLAARTMAPAGRGQIVTIASMLSFSGGYNVAAYAASKGGVAQLTKALANEWASLGINVNAIAPGYIRTQLNRHIWRDDPNRAAEVLARLPAGRWGEPEDLAGPAVFLCSPAADYLHGVILPVDGGWLSR
jgi:2-deoxy-D-gluconate 3-dehydrogenase